MEEKRKQLTFDIDTKVAKEILGEKKYTYAKNENDRREKTDAFQRKRKKSPGKHRAAEIEL